MVSTLGTRWQANIYTREYQLDSPDNGGVIIQDHSAGHPYFGGEAASPHFNVRRADNKKIPLFLG